MTIRLIIHCVLDDLGREQHGRYGVNGTLPGLAATPFLDMLWDGGVRFTQYHCASFCSPSRADHLAGRGEEDHLIGDILETDAPPDIPLSEREFTLAECLKAAFGDQILTAAIGKWHLGGPSVGGDFAPNLCGFDYFVGTKRNLADFYNDTLIVQGEERTTHGQYIPSLMADYAKHWLQRLAGDSLGRRGYLYLPWHLPHEPFHRPPLTLFNQNTWSCPLQYPSSQTTSEIVPYFKAGIEAMDALMTDVWNSIPLSLRNQTLLLVSSDNGSAPTPFTYEYNALNNPANPQHCKRSPYDFGVHVPAYAYGAGVLNGGRTSAALFHAMDWYATTMRLFGINKWPDFVDNANVYGVPNYMRSVNQAKIITGELDPVEVGGHGPVQTSRSTVMGRIFSPNKQNNGTFNGRGYCSNGTQKLVFEGTSKVAPLFFDLGSDPYEASPITSPNATQAGQKLALQNAWNAYYASLPPLPA